MSSQWKCTLKNILNSKKQNFVGVLLEDKRLKFRKGKQRELFSMVFKTRNLTHRALAEKLGVSRKTVSGYFGEENNLKLSTFNKLVLIEPAVKNFYKFVEKKLPLNWGNRKGGIATVNLLQNKNSHYFKLRQIKKNNELKIAAEKKKFIAISPLIDSLKNEKVNLESILAVCSLTDGSIQVKGNHYRISYTTIDPILEKIVFHLMNEISWNVPTIGFSKTANNIRFSDEILGKKLFRLSPNFKTSPSKNQSKEEYLQEPQPTLNFLSNANKTTKIWALRFGFTADGSISLSKYGKTDLGIACYHPTLVFEWKNFLEDLGFKCKVMKTKNSWCGYSGVRMQTYSEIKKFYNLGGFIDGVKISKKSKKYRGITKNQLLEQIIKNGPGRI